MDISSIRNLQVGNNITFKQTPANKLFKPNIDTLELSFTGQSKNTPDKMNAIKSSNISKITFKGILESLKPQDLWKDFEEISKIPRGSDINDTPGENDNVNMRLISNYLRDRLKALGFEVEQVGFDISNTNKGEDGKRLELTGIRAGGRYNVIATRNVDKTKKNATILQAHMDMVNESQHHTENDPIQFKKEGDIIRAANFRTLGADNGIGMAMILKILRNPKFENTPLQVIFTVNEESDTGGAEAIEAKDLQGQTIINFDNESEEKIVVGCAGNDVFNIENYKVPMKKIGQGDYERVIVAIKGTTGGHSGVHIHNKSINAIRAIMEELNKDQNKKDVNILRIKGGTKQNVIPSSAMVEMLVPKDKVEGLVNRINESLEKIKTEHQKYTFEEHGIVQNIDENMKIQVVRSKKAVTPETEVLDREFQDKLLTILGDKLQVGPFKFYENGYKDETLASQNLAVVKLKNGELSVIVSERCSEIDERNILLAKTTQELRELFPDKEIKPRVFPMWFPSPESVVRNAVLKVCKDFKINARPYVVHGGAEASYFVIADKKADVICIGPNIGYPHGEDENVSVSSVEKSYKLAEKLLEEVSKT